MNQNTDEVFHKMIRFCAYQDRCRQEVRDKLKEMRLGAQDVERIIDRLDDEGFLDEERFARNYARGKHRVKAWGRERIRYELRRRQLPAPMIEHALQDIDEKEYLQTLDDLAKKRFEQLREESPLKAKRKLVDYLVYRGWEWDLVYGKVESLFG